MATQYPAFSTNPTPNAFTFSASRPSAAATTATIKRKRSIDNGNGCSNNTIGSAHLGSRTMKRFRNGRPSEEVVHQYTLQKLFGAGKQHSLFGGVRGKPVAPAAEVIPPPQQQQHQASPVPHQQQPQPSNPASSSFLSFFTRRATASPPSLIPTISLACSDCDRALPLSGIQDEASVCCVGCHRPVCDSGCSTSNGEGRVCIECIPRWC